MTDSYAQIIDKHAQDMVDRLSNARIVLDSEGTLGDTVYTVVNYFPETKEIRVQKRSDMQFISLTGL